MHQIATSDFFLLLTGLASLVGLGVSVWTLVVARRIYRDRSMLVTLPMLAKALSENVSALVAKPPAHFTEQEIAERRGTMAAERARALTDVPAIRRAAAELVNLKAEPLSAQTVLSLVEHGGNLAYQLDSLARESTLRT